MLPLSALYNNSIVIRRLHSPAFGKLLFWLNDKAIIVRAVPSIDDLLHKYDAFMIKVITIEKLIRHITNSIYIYK